MGIPIFKEDKKHHPHIPKGINFFNSVLKEI